MSDYSIPAEGRSSWGRSLLDSINTPTPEAARFKTVLQGYHCRNETEELSWLTCVLALRSVTLDNFGVGAVLADSQSNILAWGHNEVFFPTFASDRHAEMVVMDRYETSKSVSADARSLRLYTSLECCPMCLTRMIISRVGTVLHVGEDETGGMTRRLHDLPSSWQKLASPQTFGRAECGAALAELATNIFLSTEDVLNARLMERGRK